MNHYRIAALAASAAIALAPAAALAQRQPPSPEQRIDRLERQVEQLQRQLFPRGRPADTAGFSSEPAATQSSVLTLDQRLDAVERQMADLLRQSEESGHRLQSVESGLASLRSDEDQRIGALEQRMAQAPVAAPVDTGPPPPPSRVIPPSPNSATRGRPAPLPPRAAPSAESDSGPSDSAVAGAATDPGEDAYTTGFHQWQSGQYDQAVATLRAFTAAYPHHKRISYANNLIGRALLDKGDARGAAEVLLANYRSNPRGDRAQDSLYYLGQALMKLGQPGQACKAYAELESVYSGKIRTDLQKQLPAAKTQAQCR